LKILENPKNYWLIGKNSLNDKSFNETFLTMNSLNVMDKKNAYLKNTLSITWDLQ
jgi:hypothetical protein